MYFFRLNYFSMGHYNILLVLALDCVYSSASYSNVNSHFKFINIIHYLFYKFNFHKISTLMLIYTNQNNLQTSV